MKGQDILWNDGWQFSLQTVGEHTPTTVQNVAWHDVELPHDWLIGDTSRLYETGEGWYRKIFRLSEKDLESVYYAAFDGVYMDSTVYVNGNEAGVWRYGYSSFGFNITAFLKEGENELLVKVTHKSPNTRWYSGAGIYRNVWLKKRSLQHILPDGLYISTKKLDGDNWQLIASVETTCPGELDFTLCKKDGTEVPCGEWTKQQDGSYTATVANPDVWDIESPSLYKLTAEFSVDGEAVDEVTETIGFRTTEFNPDKGFLLNGRRLKLHGVCMHHDLGCLGAAMNKAALRRQLETLKSFGANSIRTSHNMPAREVMELCDEMGILVNSESFDMWENSKTEMDYARYFPQWYAIDVKAWVRRDRNHPSLIMWSIGNEISDTHASPRGLEVAKMLVAAVHESDPRHNASCTIGSNFMPWENAQKVADFLKLAGYNYTEQLYREHHEKYPDWFIYGSETASAVRSRGVYHLPADTNILTHDDLQCSDMGNSVVSWGKSQESSWIMDRDCDFCGGQYVWTGFDYIGEPTPYSTKNSYFGIVDTAGLPKESYYFYKAVWTDGEKEPFIHIAPVWDWNEGEEIPVFTYSNVEDAELFLNGKSLGRQHIDLEHGDRLHGEWKVRYEPGILTARAYGKDGTVVAQDVKRSFSEAARLVITPESTELNADGRDLVFLRISAVDKDGNPVENARNRVKVKVSGAGRLAGLDSGDSTDYDSYKGDSKRLFGGLMVAVVQATFETGNITVEVSSEGLERAEVILTAKPCEKPKGVSVVKEYYPKMEQQEIKEIPLRKISLSASSTHLDESRPFAEVKAQLLPENASYKDISWKCVLKNGVESQLASAEAIDGGAKVTARGDGEFILRAMSCNGKSHPTVISDLAFTVTGLGSALINPYGFVSASLHSFSNKPLRVIERGAVSGITDRTVIGFDDVDFGSYGSDLLELYMGNSSNDPINVEVWLGDPERPETNPEMLDTVQFPPNGRWDGFEEYGFALPRRIKGLCSISFVASVHCIFGGFGFGKPDKARATLFAGDNDGLYGDDYREVENRIEKIGNNVVIEFSNMDFGEGVSKITIFGRTPNSTNSVQIRYTPSKGGEQKTQLVEFAGCEDYTERVFDLETISGEQDVSFVFMPGSDFDFGWFRFE